MGVTPGQHAQAASTCSSARATIDATAVRVEAQAWLRHHRIPWKSEALHLSMLLSVYQLKTRRPVPGIDIVGMAAAMACC